MNDSVPPEQVGRVECAPTRDPAVRWFIFAGMLIGFAFWCLSDLRQPPEAWDMKHVNQAAAYLLNNWGPVLFFPLGAVAIATAVRHLARKLVADETGIGYGRTRIAWDRFTGLDASLLASKGILRLEYDGNKQLKLDSWRLRNFKPLVAYVEAKRPDLVKG